MKTVNRHLSTCEIYELATTLKRRQESEAVHRSVSGDVTAEGNMNQGTSTNNLQNVGQGFKPFTFLFCKIKKENIGNAAILFGFATIQLSCYYTVSWYIELSILSAYCHVKTDYIFTFYFCMH